MIKKIFLNFIKVVLIILPIIVFCTDFIKSFWGPIYKLNVNSSNITAIEETLQKDNIDIENLNNVIKIELCGQGLWDYYSLNFYYSDGKSKSVNLYTTEQHYYIEEIASDVFLVIWKNKERLDINKEIAPYIAGTTKKLILKRKNNIKNNNENIENMKIYYMKKIMIYILKQKKTKK